MLVLGLGLGFVMQVLDPRRAERRRLRGPRRRDLERDALPLDGRHDRRADLRRDLPEQARRASSRSKLPPGVAGAAAVAPRPEPDRPAAAGDPRALHRRVRGGAAADVLRGGGIAVLAFVLTWFLEERPLRQTVADQTVDAAFLADLFAAPRDETLAARAGEQAEPAGATREPPLDLPGARGSRRDRSQPAAALAPLPGPATRRRPRCPRSTRASATIASASRRRCAI